MQNLRKSRIFGCSHGLHAGNRNADVIRRMCIICSNISTITTSTLYPRKHITNKQQTEKNNVEWVFDHPRHPIDTSRYSWKCKLASNLLGILHSCPRRINSTCFSTIQLISSSHPELSHFKFPIRIARIESSVQTWNVSVTAEDSLWPHNNKYQRRFKGVN